MALMKAKEIPKDAVQLEEKQAIEYVWDVVSNWDSLSDTWALRFSPAVLGGLSSIAGLTINRFYQRKLKLGNYGKMSMLIPLSLLPGVFTALFHRHLVSTDMLLMKAEVCPMCYELRSVVIQLGFGVAYPMILAPWSALMVANRYSTIRLPSLTDQPKELFKYTFNLSKPFTSTLVYMSAIHLIAASVITYFEMRNNFTLRKKLIEIENKLTVNENLE